MSNEQPRIPRALKVLAEHKNSRLFKTCVRFLGVAAVVTILMLIVVWGDTNRYSQARARGDATSHQPDRLTELYFAGAQSLPISYRLGEPIYLNFTIHNLEQQDILYHYQIVVQGSTQPLTGVARLKNGESKTISTGLVIGQPLPRAKVTVELVDQKQSIHFWVEAQK
jgi:hypothetical protein